MISTSMLDVKHYRRRTLQKLKASSKFTLYDNKISDKSNPKDFEHHYRKLKSKIYSELLDSVLLSPIGVSLNILF